MIWKICPIFHDYRLKLADTTAPSPPLVQMASAEKNEKGLK
jgi:hypothetical protein